MTDQYGLFQEGPKGPLWRGFFSDLDDAKAEARNLAEKDHLIFFVYCFKRYVEVARFKPTSKHSRQAQGDVP